MPRLTPFGYSRNFLTVNCPFTGHLDGTGQYNLMLSKAVGFACELERMEIVTTVVGTGAGATKVINVRKGSATGTVVATATVTLANQGTIAVVLAGTVVTAAEVNKFTDTDTLTIEFPTAGAVAFSAGGFDVILTFRDKNARPA